MFGEFFGAYLLERKAITREQLDEAVLLQRENNVLLGTIALQRGYIDESQLIDLLEEQHNLDRKLGELASEKGYLTGDQLQELIQIQSGNHLYLGESLLRLGFISQESMVQHLEEWGEMTMQLEEKARTQLEEFPFSELVFTAIERTRVSFFRRGYPVRIGEVASSIPGLDGLDVFAASQSSKDDRIHYYTLLLPDEFIRILSILDHSDHQEMLDTSREHAYETVNQWVFLLNYSICQTIRKGAGPRLKHGPIQSTLPDCKQCVSIKMHTLVAPFYMLYLTS
ncbi:hypothetical protein ACFL41_02340 [Gemmatimonadota bacterium]